MSENETLEEISDLVAEAVNSESYGELGEDIAEALEDLPEADRKEAIGRAWVTCVMASQPGCLPDSWAAYSMAVDDKDIREEIVSMMSGDDQDDGEIDWEAIKRDVDALDLSGDRIDAPDGQVIEVFRKSCAEILEENGIKE